MIEVRVDPRKPIEAALAIFKRKVNQDGILKEYKAHQEYLKPSIKKKIKSQEARNLKKKDEKKALKFNKHKEK
jgi:small subunit ribosomal protein S21